MNNLSYSTDVTNGHLAASACTGFLKSYPTEDCNFSEHSLRIYRWSVAHPH